jgi:hypothetical protein
MEEKMTTIVADEAANRIKRMHEGIREFIASFGWS